MKKYGYKNGKDNWSWYGGWTWGQGGYNKVGYYPKKNNMGDKGPYTVCTTCGDYLYDYRKKGPREFTCQCGAPWPEFANTAGNTGPIVIDKQALDVVQQTCKNSLTDEMYKKVCTAFVLAPPPPPRSLQGEVKEAKQQADKDEKDLNKAVSLLRNATESLRAMEEKRRLALERKNEAEINKQKCQDNYDKSLAKYQLCQQEAGQVPKPVKKASFSPLPDDFHEYDDMDPETAEFKRQLRMEAEQMVSLYTRFVANGRKLPKHVPMDADDDQDLEDLTTDLDGGRQNQPQQEPASSSDGRGRQPEQPDAAIVIT